MDIQTGLVCLGLVILSGAVLLIISMFGMKEKTYEEAIAEQRKLPEESLILGRSTKDKNKDKKKKQWKKVKEKSKKERKTSASSEPDEEKIKDDKIEKKEHAHVKINEVPDSVPVQEEKKKKKKDKIKPILVKREEPVKVEVPVNAPELNHFEEIAPKDEYELMHHPKHVDKTENDPSIQADQGEASPRVETEVEKKEEKPNVKIENVKIEATAKPETAAAHQQKPAGQSNKDVKPKKSKKNELNSLQQLERDGVNISILIPLIRKAELTRTEVQVLTDMLLNKHLGNDIQEHSEWIEGRQDPVAKLKKQLAEKEKALADEQIASQQWQNKVKELRNEFNAERTRIVQTCRQLEEATIIKQNEVQALHARLKHLSDAHNSEKQALTQKMQQLQAQINEENQIIRQLQEERQNHSAVQQELINQRQKTEMRIARMTEAENALKSQVHAQHQEFEKLNATYNQEHQNSRRLEEEIRELREQLNQSQSKLKSYEYNATQIKDSQNQELNRQIEELQRRNKDQDKKMEARLQCEEEWRFEKQRLQNELHGFTNKVSDLQTECERLAAEKQKLSSQLTETQKLKEENQQKEAALLKLGRETQELREERENLTALVTGFTERPAADGRENGDSQSVEEKKRNNVNAEFINNESECKQRDLIQQLQQEVKKSTDELKQQDAKVQTLNEEIKKNITVIETLKTEIKQKETTFQKLTDELKQTESKVLQITETDKQKDVQLKQITDKCSVQIAEINKLNENLKQKDILINKLNEELNRINQGTNEINQLKTELTQLKEELEKQRTKNNEQVSKLEAAEQEKTKLLLQKILPDIKVEEKVFQKWCEKFLNAAVEKQCPQEPSTNSVESTELEKQNRQLQSVVSHYKQIIEDTEGMLNKLQNHVEQQETSWAEQLKNKQQELDTLKVEREKSTSQLQQKVKELENVLEAKEVECNNYLSQLKQLQVEGEKLNGEKDNLPLGEIERLKEENIKLTTTLSSEQERIKELNKELTKVRSTLKMGEAAYKEEHNLALQLQKEIENLKNATNGSLNTSPLLDATGIENYSGERK